MIVDNNKTKNGQTLNLIPENIRKHIPEPLRFFVGPFNSATKENAELDIVTHSAANKLDVYDKTLGLAL